MKRPFLLTAALALCFAATTTVACSSKDGGGDGATGGSGASTTGGGDGSGGDDGSGGQGGQGDGYGGDVSVEEGTFYCGGVLCECNDGIDNNGDGLIDGFDPYCIAPWDNNESSFATGIPGDNKDPFWQDCFFDGNSGAGDDKCRYHTECITGERDSSDPSCQVVDACIDFCGQLTPNGCDCFGCCAVETGGDPVFVYIGAECSLDDLDSCTQCQQSEQCMNTCGECELCAGKTVDDLPAECGATPTCDGAPACSQSSDCDGSAYCQQGCCLPIVR